MGFTKLVEQFLFSYQGTSNVSKRYYTRKNRYEFYKRELPNIKGIRLFEENADVEKNYGYFPILIEDEYGKTRDELYSWLRENNIYVRKYFYPLTADQICFEGKFERVDLMQARNLAKRVLTLPLYEEISIEQMEVIVGKIDEFQKRI